MKTRFLVMLLTAVLLGSVSVSAVTVNKALLQHDSEVTLFDGDKVQDAVNAAVDGDVIYLTLGTFKPFNVTKNITIRGTGETSVIDGNINISIPDEPTLNNPVLETLSITGSVKVTDPLSNLYIRKCKITSDFSLSAKVSKGTIERCQIGSVSFSGVIQDMAIDRCNVNSLILSPTIESMTVNNTTIGALSASTGATNNTTFVNCILYFSSCSNFSGTIANSIVRHTTTTDKSLLSTVLLNTLIIKNTRNYTPLNTLNVGSSSVTQGCYFVNWLSDTTESNLKANGYLGSDRTVVGIYGGNTPYDDNMLVPSVPTVTSSKLDLDNENKVLNVKLTVSPQ